MVFSYDGFFLTIVFSYDGFFLTIVFSYDRFFFTRFSEFLYQGLRIFLPGSQDFFTSISLFCVGFFSLCFYGGLFTNLFGGVPSFSAQFFRVRTSMFWCLSVLEALPVFCDVV